MLLSGLTCAVFAHRFRSRRYCFDNVVVAGAAADVAVELFANGMLIEIVAASPHDVERRHDHSRCAKAALESVIFAECFLHGMQRTIRFGQPLNGGDLGTLALQSEGRAGFCCDAVDMNDAGPALRGIAADMGPGQPQIFAEKLHQQSAGFDITGDGFSVDRHGHGWHELTPNLGPKALFFADVPSDGGGSPAKSGRFSPDFHFGTRITLNPDYGPGQGIQKAKNAWSPGDTNSGARNSRGEFLKEIIGNLLGGAIDQALAKLSELAADLRLDVVREQSAAVLFSKRDRRPTLCKAGDAAVALAGDLIAVGWIEIGQMDLAFEPRLHGTDLGGGDRLKFG